MRSDPLASRERLPTRGTDHARALLRCDTSDLRAATIAGRHDDWRMLRLNGRPLLLSCMAGRCLPGQRPEGCGCCLPNSPAVILTRARRVLRPWATNQNAACRKPPSRYWNAAARRPVPVVPVPATTMACVSEADRPCAVELHRACPHQLCIACTLCGRLGRSGDAPDRKETFVRGDICTAKRFETRPRIVADRRVDECRLHLPAMAAEAGNLRLTSAMWCEILRRHALFRKT